ncbi:MAG TPA: glycosyltransferase family 2 protein [Polyangiaceae bacterium]|jgi:glycosyltransferase involved in cell wall biosynthesis|nr:glycosyltransferase family 2 protein [Polyangiaceae bacterium]
MWQSARVAVIVPCFREARLIKRTISGIPAFVDLIVVVDDASDDGTARAVQSAGDARVELRVHARNGGVGAAIVTGYRAALSAGADVLAVMAGDAQMDPEDLVRVIAPVVQGQACYVKGNRFLHARSSDMPVTRRVAGRLLATATRMATGLSVDDCQCGYTAISRRAVASLPLDELWPRFGYPNDLLGMLAARGMTVLEVPVRPVYADEQSGVRPWHALAILGLIARRYWHERATRLSLPNADSSTRANSSADGAIDDLLSEAE